MRDEPVEQVLLVVLEADVEHVRLAAGGDVARHLEGHRRLAGALGAADEQQLAGAEAAADGLVERREAERQGWYSPTSPRGDLVVQVDQDVDRRARCHAPVRAVEAPVWAAARRSASRFRRHAVSVPPGSECAVGHPSTGMSGAQPPAPAPPGTAEGTGPPDVSAPGDQPFDAAASSSQMPHDDPRSPPSKLSRRSDSLGAWACSSGW